MNSDKNNLKTEIVLGILVRFMLEFRIEDLIRFHDKGKLKQVGGPMNIGEYVKIRVKRSGMYQQLRFTLKIIDQPIGKVKVLETKKRVDLSELVRIADEYQLPVKDKDNLAVPTGKKLIDYLVE